MSMEGLRGQFALDMQGMQQLKHTARTDETAGRQEAARQFEALFLQRMMQSMRDATIKSDLIDSPQTEFYTSMLDQQWSQHLAGQGLGFAEQLVEELGGAAEAGSARSDRLIAGLPRTEAPSPAAQAEAAAPDAASVATAGPASFLDALDARPAQSAPEPTGRAAAAVLPPTEEAATGHEAPAHVQAFRERLAEPARRASRETGVPAELILSQAALETGWGRRGIPDGRGGDSHNLFGIKAGRHWEGETVEIVTHEYIDGRRQAITDRFRVYPSPEAAFTDYARMIGDNPRYSGVVTAPDAEDAARALQAGGYATDPAYADKLVAVMHTLGPLPGASRLAAQ
ncbi:flagellar assembly peptidoglycan hydrolase FlgJ [Halomonas sp. YLGW01]|uniref:flagellar assembly peptidoglycan hydrolase FlgJ n=1 Tax=Halomonas sp. YLGW01 TaxID=2773308 RepID=UPI00177CEEFD|nr:flagellar assembly peptidoglycan hydrolase FlgJ [Halomonas sp. YLGW01]